MGKGVKIAVGKSYVGGDIGIEYEDSFEISRLDNMMMLTTNPDDIATEDLSYS